MNSPRADGEDVGSEISNIDTELAELRADRLAERRRRDRWHLERRREATTVLSALQSSVGKRLTIHLIVNESIVGSVVEVGIDYVAIDSVSGVVWIAVRSIAAVEGSQELAADPEDLDPAKTMLVDVLEDLLAVEARLALTLVSGATIACRPISIGSSLIVQHLATGSSLVTQLESVAMIRRTA